MPDVSPEGEEEEQVIRTSAEDEGVTRAAKVEHFWTVMTRTVEGDQDVTKTSAEGDQEVAKTSADGDREVAKAPSKVGVWFEFRVAV